MQSKEKQAGNRPTYHLFPVPKKETKKREASLSL